MTSTSMASPRHVVWQESRRDAGNPQTCPNKTKDMWKCRLHRGKGLALNQLVKKYRRTTECAQSASTMTDIAPLLQGTDTDNAL